MTETEQLIKQAVQNIKNKHLLKLLEIRANTTIKINHENIDEIMYHMYASKLHIEHRERKKAITHLSKALHGAILREIRHNSDLPEKQITEHYNKTTVAILGAFERYETNSFDDAFDYIEISTHPMAWVFEQNVDSQSLIVAILTYAAYFNVFEETLLSYFEYRKNNKTYDILYRYNIQANAKLRLIIQPELYDKKTQKRVFQHAKEISDAQFAYNKRNKTYLHEMFIVEVSEYGLSINPTYYHRKAASKYDIKPNVLHYQKQNTSDQWENIEESEFQTLIKDNIKTNMILKPSAYMCVQ